MYTVGNGWRTRNLIHHIVVQTVVGISISHVSVTVAAGTTMSSILLVRLLIVVVVVYAVGGRGEDGFVVRRGLFTEIVGAVPGLRQAFLLHGALLLYMSQLGGLMRRGRAHAERRAMDGFAMVLCGWGGLVLEVKRVCTNDVSRQATFAESR